eukprot:3719393-Amphidinium_carterae.1
MKVPNSSTGEGTAFTPKMKVPTVCSLMVACQWQLPCAAPFVLVSVCLSWPELHRPCWGKQCVHTGRRHRALHRLGSRPLQMSALFWRCLVATVCNHMASRRCQFMVTSLRRASSCLGVGTFDECAETCDEICGDSDKNMRDLGGSLNGCKGQTSE